MKKIFNKVKNFQPLFLIIHSQFLIQIVLVGSKSLTINITVEKDVHLKIQGGKNYDNQSQS